MAGINVNASTPVIWTYSLADATSYRISWGPSPGNYTSSKDFAHPTKSSTIGAIGISAGQQYAVMTPLDSDGNGQPSSEIPFFVGQGGANPPTGTLVFTIGPR